ncbi:hypothetical protein ACJJTC_013144 [Scirpophaga incertulas]
MEIIVSWLVLCVAGIHASSCGYGNTSALPSQLQGVRVSKGTSDTSYVDNYCRKTYRFAGNYNRSAYRKGGTAKGTAALGYFEVTHDVSHYTKADVFNGVGKKTPLVVRFSTGLQSLGGPDVSKEDPLFFKFLVVAFKRNPGNKLIRYYHLSGYYHNKANNFT